MQHRRVSRRSAQRNPAAQIGATRRKPFLYGMWRSWLGGQSQAWPPGPSRFEWDTQEYLKVAELCRHSLDRSAEVACAAGYHLSIPLSGRAAFRKPVALLDRERKHPDRLSHVGDLVSESPHTSWVADSPPHEIHRKSITYETSGKRMARVGIAFGSTGIHFGVNPNRFFPHRRRRRSGTEEQCFGGSGWLPG